MEYSLNVGFDWIVDSIFSYLGLIPDRKKGFTELGNVA